MKSIFDTPVFGSRGLPGYAPPALGEARLAQETTAPAPATAPSESDVFGLKSAIEDLLKQLPPDVLGSYSTKYRQCQDQMEAGGAVGMAAGGKCLYALYNEIKDFIEHGPPKKAQAPAAPPSAFPVLPVAVGGLGLLVLIWGLSKL